MKNNVFVIDGSSGLEVVKVIDNNFLISASKKVKIHKRMVDTRRSVYTFVCGFNSSCPFCNKNNIDRAGFDLAIVFLRNVQSIDIGVFDENGVITGLLGGGIHVSEGDYEVILRIRSFTPSDNDYISLRIKEMGLGDTKYEKIIREYFLNFSTRESLSLSLSAHRTTVSRAIKKIVDVCRVCGY